MSPSAAIITGHAREALAWLEPGSAHAIVTSPPYWRQRDYGHPDQLGQEPAALEYVDHLVAILEAAGRALRPGGALWLNLADTYHRGELAGIPWRVAFALHAAGYRLRQDVIWHKPNPMPESVRDRCTRAHEYLFYLTKPGPAFFDNVAIAEPAAYPAGPGNTRPPRSAPSDRLRSGLHATGGRATRNPRSVWTITPARYAGAHFATMPEALVRRCLEATVPALACPACGAGYQRIVARTRTPTRPGARSKTYAAAGGARTIGNRDPRRHVTTTRTIGHAAGCDCAAADAVPGLVLDPFAGAGTVPAVAVGLGRRAVAVELNPDYAALAVDRIRAACPAADLTLITYPRKG